MSNLNRRLNFNQPSSSGIGNQGSASGDFIQSNTGARRRNYSNRSNSQPFGFNRNDNENLNGTGYDRSQRNERFRSNHNSNVGSGHFNPNVGSGHFNPNTANLPNRGNQEKNEHRFKKRFMGFKKLEELSLKDSEDIIIELSNDRKGFQELLSMDVSNDMLVLILKVLCKMCESNFESNKTAIFNAIHEKFLKKLIDFLLRLPIQNQHDRKSSKYFWSNIDEFWKNLMKICSEIISAIPSTAVDVLPQLIKTIHFVIPNFEDQHKIVVSSQLKNEIEELEKKLLICREEVEKKKKEVKRKIQEPEPPDDFRTISIYPTVVEITQTEMSFVRQNKIDGPYDSVEQYLDIQFRLLREDFVAPLREGICDYLYNLNSGNSRNRKRLFSVKVYPKIQFIGTQNVNDIVGIKLKFDFSQSKKKFKYENSKRFMFGALLCFTKDNFQTVIFAKIIERDIKLLEIGELVVEFVESTDECTFFEDYVMVECSVYFEPYYHVLSALQNMDEYSFPMKDYLIDVDPFIGVPAYLTLGTLYSIDGMVVVPHDPRSWPNNPKVFNLNEVQYEAFKCTLSRNFVIIQGPPGTGKTYLGLKITQTLLKNKMHWYPQSRTPILVVCYTNHALDQFLEGLIGSTDRMIRVGAQSKNEALQNYNIKNKRKEHIQNNRDSAHVLFTKRKELSELMNKIKAANAILNCIEKYNCILNLQDFKIYDPEYAKSWFALKASRKDILDWLLGGRTKQEMEKEAWEIKIKEFQKQMGAESSAEPSAAADDSDDEKMFDAENRVENRLEIDEDIGIDTDTRVVNLNTYTLVKLEDLKNDIKMFWKNLAVLNATENPDNSVVINIFNTQRQIEELQDTYNYLEACLLHGRNMINEPKLEFTDYKSPHNMMPLNRWKFYFFWLGQYQKNLLNSVTRWNLQYQTVYKEYMEVKDIEDVSLMRGMHIIGMTTTGAARLQTILKALKCKIVIVEEAAEVLESHIIVSLTNRCEHLILLGDHQQLRPSTANFTMEKDFNLGISLFERMIRNKMPCTTLKVQHRMRPEISSLIKPAIYSDLVDHESVLEYPPVKGIDHCLFFIHHTHEEQSLEHTSSKRNIHEATFLIRLARHLVLNGYEPEDITILSAYLGQMYLMWEERKKYKALLNNVKITVLDNYQGEESKIILLSLVRNNKEGKIGFLATENRVCVALSRAKQGFYIMGNMDMLCDKSKIWPKIKEAFVVQNALGNELTLRCHFHQDVVTKVSNSEDFDQVPEGGCGQRCNAQLSCGHLCLSCCHIQNREHVNYHCKVKCTKKLCEVEDHVCKNLCFEECGPCTYMVQRVLACGHETQLYCHIDPDTIKCITLVQTELPCGHTTNKPCHIDVDKFRCPFPCDSRIEPCGHACTLSCHIKNDPDHLNYKCMKPCAKVRRGCTLPESDHLCNKFCFEECLPCDIVVKKFRTICPHVYEIRCDANVDEIVCQRPCKKKLSCGHKCKKPCFEECKPCRENVSKILSECGHLVKTLCFMEPQRENCIGKCPRMLPCGHKCEARCNQPCTSKCLHLVDNTSVEAACKHKFKIPCYMNQIGIESNDFELLKYCTEKCSFTLECKHKCSGSCGECAQGRVHKQCAESCGRILVCSHECTTPCSEACQPCIKPCTYKCVHSKCKKKCGEVCSCCMENCIRRCPHVECKAKCGRMCSVKPCTKPCPKILKCKHPCVGFCGDPCPPLCRICNKDELEEIFFGYEDEEDAKFVLLLECRHVLESKGLEGWMNQESNEIKVACCPKCKTRLTHTQRFSDYIKKSRQDIDKVKQQFIGSFEENRTNAIELNKKIINLTENNRILLLNCKEFSKLLIALMLRLKVSRNNRRQLLHSMTIKSVTSKVQIIEYIIDVYKTAEKLRKPKIVYKAIDFLLKFLNKNEDYITNQEIEDLKLEILRLTRIVELCKIEEDYNYAPSKDIPKVKIFYDAIVQEIHSVYKYSDQKDLNIKNLLTDLTKEIKSTVVVTEAERREIVQAVGLTRGHWFKCPNGHPYAIGECGGAMEVAKCVCGAPIGGTNHALLGTNRHAPEMDGSQHPAWSEQANLQNYRL